MIVISHFGRPKGGPDAAVHLKPVADKLAELLGAAGRVRRRLHRRAGGAKPSPRCSRARSRCWRTCASTRARRRTIPPSPGALATLGDIFVNDAFSTAHRAHASTEAIARLLPSYAGPLLMEEINALRSVLDKPERPVAAVIGGAKVSTQDPGADQSRRQGRQAHHRRRHGQHLPAGAGRRASASRWPSRTSPRRRCDIMHAAKERSCEVVLPHDVVVAAKFEAGCGVPRAARRSRRPPTR